MRSTLLYWIYSGQLYFAAVVLLVVAMLLPKRIAGITAMLSVALTMFSGPLAGSLVVIAGFTVWSLTRARPSAWMRAIAVAICVVAIAIELPYHIGGQHVPAPSRIFVIGDSLASGGFGEPMPWPAILEKKLGVPVTNLSLASSSVAMAIERQAPSLPRPGDDREMVIVEIGGNDMLDGTPAPTFAADLDRLLSSIAKDRTVVMLEIPLLPGQWLYGPAQRRLARKHRCTLIPKRVLARVLTQPGQTFDGIHLTQSGHEALANALVRSLR